MLLRKINLEMKRLKMTTYRKDIEVYILVVKNKIYNYGYYNKVAF